MALNFENIGTPIAKIIDKNKKELKLCSIKSLNNNPTITAGIVAIIR